VIGKVQLVQTATCAESAHANHVTVGSTTHHNRTCDTKASTTLSHRGTVNNQMQRAAAETTEAPIAERHIGTPQRRIILHQPATNAGQQQLQRQRQRQRTRPMTSRESQEPAEQRQRQSDALGLMEFKLTIVN
jgi:hypothetical protein